MNKNFNPPFLLIILLATLALSFSPIMANTNFQTIESYLKTSASDRQKMSQDYLAHPLTEKSVLAISVIESADLRAKYQELLARKAAYSREFAMTNPIVGASYLPQGTSSKIDISVEQDLIKWLVLPLESHAVDRQFDADKLTFSEVILDHFLETKKALIGYYVAQSMVAIQTDFTTAAEAIFELTQRQYKTGNISESQLKTNEITYQEALALGHLENLHLQQSKLELHTLIGLDPDQTEWTVTGSLTESLPESPSLNVLDQLIEIQRPDLAALRARIEFEKSRLDAKIVEDWGSLKLGLQYEKDFDGTPAIGPKIEFGLPLFNQGQTSSQEKEGIVAQLSELLTSHKRNARLAMRKK